MKRRIYLLFAFFTFSNLAVAITSDESTAIMSKCRMHHTQEQCNRMLRNIMNNEKSESADLSQQQH